MMAFRDKRAEFAQRVRELSAAASVGERDLCDAFQQHIDELVAAQMQLQQSDTKAVSSELAAIDACIASWSALFSEERTVTAALHSLIVTCTQQLSPPTPTAYILIFFLP